MARRVTKRDRPAKRRKKNAPEVIETEEEIAAPVEQDDEAPVATDGEVQEYDDDLPDVEDTPDGGAIVRIDDTEVERNPEHFANIVEEIDPVRLKTFATNMVELIDRDKEARKRRDQQYEEGIRRTGLGEDAPGGAQFTGASKVVHPMLTEASVDFEARAIKELFPANGPVKSYIPGEPTKEKLAKAERKARHMNWQLTKQNPEFRAELEQILTQLPLGGVQYLKLGWDQDKKRWAAIAVFVDDMLVPFAATNFYTAERKTHVQKITEQEYDRRVTSGMYRDADLLIPSNEPEQTKAEVANEKIEGKQPTSYNEDGLRTVFETACLADLEDEEDVVPYIVTIDEQSQEVLSVYRNWMPEDDNRNELIWIIEFPFVPWRGAYPIGLSHMIGGLTAAATGSLRALMDAALINNFPGALKLKGGGKGGQSEVVNPTQISEIEGSINTSDIRQVIMPFPFNPPSTVLYQLLGFLVDAGRGVVRTTFENLSDNNPNMPVGTTVALIEQGMTVFSAIHGRLHNAMARLLEVLHRINFMYLEEDDLCDEAGELLAYRMDYEGPMDVIPVSDPNIFSETQRFAQISAVMQRADSHPQLYDARAVETAFLQQMKLPDYEKLLVKPFDPKPMNAANENVVASLGRPISAFPDQDHIAHLQVLLEFMESPFLGSNPIIAPTYLPVALGHAKEHIVLYYLSAIYSTIQEVTDSEPESLFDKDKEISAAYDRLIAGASMKVVPGMAQVLEKVPPVLIKAIQTLQALQPPAPADPTQVAAEASAAETQRRTAADQARAQLDNKKVADNAAIAKAKLDQQAKDEEADIIAKRQEQVSEALRTQAEIDSRELMNNQDNQTALTIASAEILSGDKSALSTGTGINP